MTNKTPRLFVKQIRDKQRSTEKPKIECFVTRKKVNLELHHLYSLSDLVNTFLLTRKLTNSNRTELRDEFLKLNKEKVDEQYVLTKEVHARLHNIFGGKYSQGVVPKVRIWLARQREKNELVSNIST